MNLEIKVVDLPEGDRAFDFAAAIDDATDSNGNVGFKEGTRRGVVDVETSDPIETILTIAGVATEFGVRIVSVDELVTAADIAQRTGRTRGSVGHLISGIRGNGLFPAPINEGARHELYRWAQVEAWFNADERPAELETADSIAVLDAVVRLHTQILGLPSASRQQLANRVKGSMFTPFAAVIAPGPFI